MTGSVLAYKQPGVPRGGGGGLYEYERATWRGQVICLPRAGGNSEMSPPQGLPHVQRIGSWLLRFFFYFWQRPIIFEMSVGEKFSKVFYGVSACWKCPGADCWECPIQAKLTWAQMSADSRSTRRKTRCCSRRSPTLRSVYVYIYVYMYIYIYILCYVIFNIYIYIYILYARTYIIYKRGVVSARNVSGMYIMVMWYDDVMMWCDVWCAHLMTWS